MDERGINMRNAITVHLEVDAHQCVLVSVLRTPLVERQGKEYAAVEQHIEGRKALVGMRMTISHRAARHGGLLVAPTEFATARTDRRIAQCAHHHVGPLARFIITAQEVGLADQGIAVDNEAVFATGLAGEVIAITRSSPIGCLAQIAHTVGGQLFRQGAIGRFERGIRAGIIGQQHFVLERPLPLRGQCIAQLAALVHEGLQQVPHIVVEGGNQNAQHDAVGYLR